MSLVPTAKNGLDRLLRLFIIAYQRRTQEPTRGARRTEARALGHGRYKHVINVSIERAFSSRFQFCKSASYRSICVRAQSPRSVPAWKARYHSTTQSGVCFKGSTGRQPRKAPRLGSIQLEKMGLRGMQSSIAPRQLVCYPRHGAGVHFARTKVPARGEAGGVLRESLGEHEISMQGLTAMAGFRKGYGSGRVGPQGMPS
jgi:hypothetical protein